MRKNNRGCSKGAFGFRQRRGKQSTFRLETERQGQIEIQIYQYKTKVDSLPTSTKASSKLVSITYHREIILPRLTKSLETRKQNLWHYKQNKECHQIQYWAGSGPKTHDRGTHPTGQNAGVSSTCFATKGQIYTLAPCGLQRAQPPMRKSR
jgi:hypothetical protein